MEDIIQGGQPDAAATQADPAQPAQPEPQTPPAAKVSLAETIRQAREEREGRARAETAHKDMAAQLAQAKAELEAERAAAKDAIAFARARKMSREEQAEFGQALLYDLVPEKAPPDYRVRLLESRIARDAREKEEAAKVAAERAQVEANTKILNDYQAAVHQAASSFAEGSHPESEAWFDADRDAWARSLLATSQNLARTARESGQQVDLSPANVARVLEADIAARQARRDKRKGSTAQTKGSEGSQAPDGTVQRSGNPTSTKGLTTGGPRGPALTEKERVERAIAAAFPTR